VPYLTEYEIPIKDPSALLDYVVDWAPWLTGSGADTLASVTWTATGLTVDHSSFTTTDATIWISGGVVGALYAVTCHVVTAAGRIDERSFHMRIREK